MNGIRHLEKGDVVKVGENSFTVAEPGNYLIEASFKESIQDASTSEHAERELERQGMGALEHMRTLQSAEPAESITITDLVLTRKQARELAQKTHQETGQVVTVQFQGGREIAGRELTPREKRDARRCPSCRSTRIQDTGNGHISCRWCGWKGDPEAFVRPSLELRKPTLRPVDFDHEGER